MINFHKRTFIKGLTWECSGLIILFLIMYFGVVPDAIVASMWTIVYTIVRIGMYYIHDRIWKKTSWGKFVSKEGKSD